ncbi:MAG: heliorhodopsin HeR [Patescibacteria group bacterium]|jgi:hypothetical protein
MEEKFKRLKTLNAWACLLHLVSGILMVALSTNLEVPITASFLHFDRFSQTLVPQMETLFSIKLGLLVASFLFMSSIAHFLIAFPLNSWYNKNLKNNINIARWIEYAFSSSVMMVVISFLVGMSDIATLIVIFFLNAMMILFGWMMELHNQTLRQCSEQAEKVNWTAYIFGCIAGIGPWIAVAIYLASPGVADNPPTFVYWIFFSIFIFFNIFAVNQILQYKKFGKWNDYLYGEKVYIILSFVAKSLLAWQVFAGTLRP